MALILLVDDEPAILQVLRINLESEGHDVHLAGDGETALRRIESVEPDLVILDIMMPVIDGWEVLRRMKDMKLRRRPRTIVMTAKGGLHDVKKGFELGADEYLTKPYDLEELLATVEDVITRSAEENGKRKEQVLSQDERGPAGGSDE